MFQSSRAQAPKRSRQRGHVPPHKLLHRKQFAGVKVTYFLHFLRDPAVDQAQACDAASRQVSELHPLVVQAAWGLPCGWRGKAARGRNGPWLQSLEQ